MKKLCYNPKMDENSSINIPLKAIFKSFPGIPLISIFKRNVGAYIIFDSSTFTYSLFLKKTKPYSLIKYVDVRIIESGSALLQTYNLVLNYSDSSSAITLGFKDKNSLIWSVQLLRSKGVQLSSQAAQIAEGVNAASVSWQICFCLQDLKHV